MFGCTGIGTGTVFFEHLCGAWSSLKNVRPGREAFQLWVWGGMLPVRTLKLCVTRLYLADVADQITQMAHARGPGVVQMVASESVAVTFAGRAISMAHMPRR